MPLNHLLFLIIPVLGCFIASAYTEELNALFHDILSRIIPMHPELSERALARIVYGVIAVSIILFIFLWPIVWLWNWITGGSK